VVTYDENGGYGHPDHIQAHRIAMAATESTGIPGKLYYTAVPRSGVEQLMAYMKETGAATEDFELPEDFGVPDEMITSVLDVLAHVDRKRKALEAHASQGENIFLLRLPEEAQEMAFGFEPFIRKICRVEAPEKEDDLFAGLRG
jgi:LmbE family N-acetylglucosaminyl deacetylase